MQTLTHGQTIQGYAIRGNDDIRSALVVDGDSVRAANAGEADRMGYVPHIVVRDGEIVRTVHGLRELVMDEDRTWRLGGNVQVPE